jgi:hypothetical protein
MEHLKENFIIEFKEQGVSVSGRNGGALRLTASEALMLLDILKNEEKQLRKIAEKSSPIQLTIRNCDDI